MKLCYQVATPDVEISPAVTAFQGDIDTSLDILGEFGFQGVEFMTINPLKLDWAHIEKAATRNDLDIVLVCTGEIYGQQGLTFMDPDENIRLHAIKRVKEMMDFAAYFGAMINIGRVRGQYRDTLPRGLSYQYALEGFKSIAEYGEKKNVKIAIEPVTYMQTNFINTAAEAIQICKEVGSEQLKIMLDLFHLNIEEKDILQTIRDSKDDMIHIHLADNNRRYPGMGGFDFEKILGTIHETGYKGAVCTEIYQLPNQLEAVQGTARTLIPILQKLY